jgi:hypothetical protein
MLNLSKFKITHKGLYWGLIITFAILYLCVGFVSTLHSITFFGLANSLGLAILLGLTYEVGQASVLFSILMTDKNKNTFLPWALMFLLTALQVTANVYASFKFMVTSGSNDWVYWQKSILFGVQASSPEMYQMIISWIAGALLPIVALGMTALVAQNINFINEEAEKEEQTKVGTVPDEEVDKVINDEVEKRVASLISTAKIADLENPSKFMPIEQIEPLTDFDETGIGGEPTPEEQQKISEYIAKEEKLMSDFAYSDKEINDTLEKEENEETILERYSEPKEPMPYIMADTDIISPPKKKAGRPPKQKETVAEPKKEQGLLQKEENVEVPQEKPVKSRTIDPLKRKSTTQVVTDLEEIIKPSKGDEVLKLISSLNKAKTDEPITEPVISEEMSHEASLVPPELRTPYIEGGVEVIDAKAIPKKPEVKKN